MKMEDKVINVSVTLPDNSTIKGDLLVYSRSGTKSPESYLFLYRGLRLTEYEMKKKGWRLSIPSFLRIQYRNIDMSALVYGDNPFLKMIEKDKAYNGAYYPVPPCIVKL